MTRILLILLLSLTAFGQPSPINRRAFALSGLANASICETPNCTPGLLYWWVASDLTNQVDPVALRVTNWVDRIRGAPMTNILTGTFTAPYLFNNILVRCYRTNGLYSGTNITVNLTSFNSTYSMMVIGDQRQASVTGAFSSEDNSSMVNLTSTKHLRWSGDDLGPRADNAPFDFFIGPFAAVDRMLTNGVPVYTNSGVTFTYMNNFCVGLIGDIYEIVVWTNSTYFTDANLAAMHKYATNTYGYTP